MKRIGLLISQMNKGGAERVVSRLTGILNSDYKVYLIVFESTYMAYEHKAELIDLNIPSSPKKLKKLLLPIIRARTLKKNKDKYNLDCVISFMDSPNIVNIISKTDKCKVAISIRNYSEIENSRNVIGRIFSLAVKSLYNRADIIIPVTKEIEKLYVKKYRVRADKFKVIYNPYDINEIKGLSREAPVLSELYNIANKFKFVTMGRQVYQKGYWHLIKAFKLVHDKYPDAVLVMIGQDHQDGKVQELASKLSLDDSILLLGYHSNPFGILSQCNAYVLTSLFEGFPNALVEAMACGLPVISADCKSGPREILYKDHDIEDACSSMELADYGILVKPLEEAENWDENIITEGEMELCKAMQLLVTNDAIRDKYVKMAFSRASDFSYEACRLEFIDAIESVIKHDFNGDREL